MTKVMISPATYQSLDRALDRAFSLFPPDVRGKKVLVKPNVLRPSAPSEAIATHPAMLRAVVERLETMGPASLIVGDNPGVMGYGANEDAFRKTGLLEAAKGYYQNIGDDSETMAFNPEFAPTVSVSRAALEADVVISLPKFKTHGLVVMSGAIKNSYGLLPGAQKAKLHMIAGSAERFHELIVDVFRLRVPDLFIVDAVLAMEGNGPASPDLRDVGLLLASDNAVALDAVIATMMGCEPGRLPFLRKARALGLGDYDLGKIEIDGELRSIPGFKLPPLSGEAILSNEAGEAFLHSRAAMRPQADPDLCSGCAACVDQCPVSALSIGDDNLPHVDAAACIACFCCQEICPEKAMTLG